MTFLLHARLAADTLPVGDLTLSTVRLTNDARFPWLILVPRRAGLIELFDLTAAERATLIEEIATAARTLKEVTDATKMNVGAIGNLVPQLHIHIVARIVVDAAWPAPVWGHGQPVPYRADRAAALVASLVRALPFSDHPGPYDA